MAIIHYHQNQYESNDDESVLDALLRHDVDIPYACKAGVCHVCVMICEQGTLPSDATNGMNESLIDQGNFLACQCQPKEPIVIRDADECGLFSAAFVAQKVIVSERVCRLRLRLPTKMYYRAGQFINVQSPQGQIRSYSLASLPTQDDFLELYVKRMHNGVVSNWLFDQVAQGDTIQLQGPYGDCFYQPDSINNDILMIGTGTGLTPLIGILRDAIECNHQSNIEIYHGESHKDSLFYHQELLELARSHHNIHYFPCVSSKGEELDDDMLQGRASNQAFSQERNLKNHLIYLCGSPTMVESSRNLVLSRGALEKNIYIDPFFTKELRSASRT